MSIIKEIRELTGLSHAKLAAWLGVSKSLVQFAEYGERTLQGDASRKLTLLVLPVQQLKDAVKTIRRSDAVLFLNPAAFKQQHKKKMEHHLGIAAKLEQQLYKLQLRHVKLNTRLLLLDIMKNLDTESYRSTNLDKHVAGLLEFFGRDRMWAGFQKIENLQDRIDIHLAYAEIHKQRWERFEGMENKQELHPLPQ